MRGMFRNWKTENLSKKILLQKPKREEFIFFMQWEARDQSYLNDCGLKFDDFIDVLIKKISILIS